MIEITEAKKSDIKNEIVDIDDTENIRTVIVNLNFDEFDIHRF